MEIYSLASGSSGNSYVIVHNKRALLLDAGLSGKKLIGALADVGVDPAWIEAVLVSHEHNDHVAGAGIISRKLNVPVYMTRGTWMAAAEKLGPLPRGKIIIRSGTFFRVADLLVTAYPICHDAREPVNYVFSTGAHKAAVLTDTGCVNRSMLHTLAQCHALILEANHSAEMLFAGPYPWPLKQRIASRQGHLSNAQAARIAAWLSAHGQLRQVQLGHLSAVNNTPDLARGEVAEYLARQRVSRALCRNVQVLPRQQPGPILQVK